jgi:calcium-dependent protein kinase
MQIKILDFNVAKKMTPGMKMITKTGLVEWSAPEMLNGIPYSEKVDLWSAGCVFYYVLLGKKPFKTRQTEKLHRSISSGEFKVFEEHKISKEAFDLMKKLMNVDMDNRLSASEALAHPFLSESPYSEGIFSSPLKYQYEQSLSPLGI